MKTYHILSHNKISPRSENMPVDDLLKLPIFKQSQNQVETYTGIHELTIEIYHHSTGGDICSAPKDFIYTVPRYIYIAYLQHSWPYPSSVVTALTPH